MNEVKRCFATIKAQVPEWLPQIPELNIPSLQDWNLPRPQDWNLPRPQNWTIPRPQDWTLPNPSEWSMPNIYELGRDGRDIIYAYGRNGRDTIYSYGRNGRDTIYSFGRNSRDYITSYIPDVDLPQWIYPSYVRSQVRDYVLSIWVLFITFLAAREVEDQQQLNDSNQDIPTSEVIDHSYSDETLSNNRKISSLPELEEEEEEVEEWREGLGERGGLARYPGFENLLAESPMSELPICRPSPLSTVLRDVNKQDSEESDILEATEEQETQQKVNEQKDELWESLLAKYVPEEDVPKKQGLLGEEENVPEFVGTADEIVKRYAAKFESVDTEKQDLDNSVEEFSAKIGKRLEEYLSRLEENDEETSMNADLTTDDVQEIEVEKVDAKEQDVTENDNNHVSIIIEDDLKGDTDKVKVHEKQGFDEMYIAGETGEVQMRPLLEERRQSGVTVRLSGVVIEEEFEESSGADTESLNDKNVEFDVETSSYFNEKQEGMGESVLPLDATSKDDKLVLGQSYSKTEEKEKDEELPVAEDGQQEIDSALKESYIDQEEKELQQENEAVETLAKARSQQEDFVGCLPVETDQNMVRKIPAITADVNVETFEKERAIVEEEIGMLTQNRDQALEETGILANKDEDLVSLKQNELDEKEVSLSEMKMISVIGQRENEIIEDLSTEFAANIYVEEPPSKDSILEDECKEKKYSDTVNEGELNKYMSKINKTGEFDGDGETHVIRDIIPADTELEMLEEIKIQTDIDIVEGNNLQDCNVAGMVNKGQILDNESQINAKLDYEEISGDSQNNLLSRLTKLEKDDTEAFTDSSIQKVKMEEDGGVIQSVVDEITVKDDGENKYIDSSIKIDAEIEDDAKIEDTSSDKTHNKEEIERYSSINLFNKCKTENDKIDIVDEEISSQLVSEQDTAHELNADKVNKILEVKPYITNGETKNHKETEIDNTIASFDSKLEPDQQIRIESFSDILYIQDADVNQESITIDSTSGHTDDLKTEDEDETELVIEKSISPETDRQDEKYPETADKEMDNLGVEDLSRREMNIQSDKTTDDSENSFWGQMSNNDKETIIQGADEQVEEKVTDDSISSFWSKWEAEEKEKEITCESAEVNPQTPEISDEQSHRIDKEENAKVTEAGINSFWENWKSNDKEKYPVEEDYVKEENKKMLTEAITTAFDDSNMQIAATDVTELETKFDTQVLTTAEDIDRDIELLQPSRNEAQIEEDFYAQFSSMEEDQEGMEIVDEHMPADYGDYVEDDLDGYNAEVEDGMGDMGSESPVMPDGEEGAEDYPDEVHDLLVRRSSKRPEWLLESEEMEEEIPDNPLLAKYLAMPASLTEEEEIELRNYLAENEGMENIDLAHFMAMSHGLTEQEEEEFTAAIEEQEKVREAERQGLEKFLTMPAGLTEQEKRELLELEAEEVEHAKQPWEEGDAQLDDYMKMPSALTEEERQLLDDEDLDDMEFENEEQYRQYIKEKFLRQLEDEACCMVDDEGEYDDEYDYEDEYEEGDYDEEEIEGDYIMIDDETAHPPENVSGTMVDNGVNTEQIPESHSTEKKIGKKLLSFVKKNGKESNDPEGATSLPKKFFHFGGLGAKKKKETRKEEDDDSPSGKKPGGGGGSIGVSFCTVTDKVPAHLLEHFSLKHFYKKKDGSPSRIPVKIPSQKLIKLDERISKLMPKYKSSISNGIDKSDVLRKLNYKLNIDGSNGTEDGKLNETPKEIEHVMKISTSKQACVTDSNTSNIEGNYCSHSLKNPVREDATYCIDYSRLTSVEDIEDVNDLHVPEIIIGIENDDLDEEEASVFNQEIEEALPIGVCPEGVEPLKGGRSPFDGESDFWKTWRSEEQATVPGVRDSASPWDLSEDEDNSIICDNKAHNVSEENSVDQDAHAEEKDKDTIKSVKLKIEAKENETGEYDEYIIDRELYNHDRTIENNHDVEANIITNVAEHDFEKRDIKSIPNGVLISTEDNDQLEEESKVNSDAHSQIKKCDDVFGSKLQEKKNFF